MKSIAIVNGARPNDGITYGLLPYYMALKKASYNVVWYQIINLPGDSCPVTEAKCLVGKYCFNYELSNGLNRLIFLRGKVKVIKEDIIILSDPTLLTLFDDFSKIVVKIHDFRPLSKYGDKFLTRLMFHFVKRKLKKVKSAIFTTSFVENEALHLGISPINKFLIPDPVLMCEEPQKHIETSLKKINLGSITVTYIAADRPYKNIDFFLAISNEFSNLKRFQFLLLSKVSKERLSYIRNNFKNVTILTGVDDIRQIYERTDIVIYPTLYEGFGRPVIEAMSFGIPIIATDLEPIRENGEGSVILCSENDIRCWRENILNLCDTNNYLEKSLKSLKRFEYFSPLRFEERVYQMINILSNK